MELIDKEIPLNKLEKMSEKMFGDLVKAVVDVEKNIMVVDAELHADEEAYLIKLGSEQKNLWGINLYPELFNSSDFIEYDSMINLRPNQNNKNRGVEDQEIQNKIKKIVNRLIK